MTLAQQKPSNLESTVRMLGEAAKIAAAELALAAPERKTAALHAMAKAIRDRNAGYMTVMLEGTYTDEYLAEAGGGSPVFTDEELKIISEPLDFVGRERRGGLVEGYGLDTRLQRTGDLDDVFLGRRERIAQRHRIDEAVKAAFFEQGPRIGMELVEIDDAALLRQLADEDVLGGADVRNDLGFLAHEAEAGATRFERTFHVGNAFDRDQVRAKMEDGILTVTLPKSAEKVGRKIDVA